MITEFIQFSLTPILIGILAGISCAVPGNFLILKRQALIGDAISHVVLPGIVIAFIFTGVISTIPMLLGAAGAALVAVILIEVIKRLGKIEPGAAMGVVFTGMFALGVLILEQTDTSKVHLDVEHALMGNLESLIWLKAQGWQSLFDLDVLKTLPDELFRIIFVCGFILSLTVIFWRWLKIVTFDEEYARTIGIHSSIINFSLVIITAIAAVAAFESVGSIIVIAMFICPPAAARLMTNKLGIQVIWSIVFAILAAIFGYIIAGYGPLWFGSENSVSAAGMIAVVSGIILLLTCMYGPCRESVGQTKD
ncbi:MAG: metal ABC transporter permease [Pseudomonadota bacterium]|nr:metal ABC transporter permease [Pseudomonadota bacterium]MEC8452531.1 metal ABC transporter permease [Pseudomonadota bacterium]